MKILNPAAVLTPVAKTSSNNLLQQISVGQQLIAKVIERLPQKNFLLLSVDGHLLRAHSNVPLVPKQSILLEVIKTGEQPLLKVIDTAISKLDAQAISKGLSPKWLIAQTMRHHLPKQITLSVFHKYLSGLNQTTKNLSLPYPIENSINMVLNVFPKLALLSNPISLREIIRNSGLFFEAKHSVASNIKTSTGTHDIKETLLKLLAALKFQEEAKPLTKEMNVTNRSVLSEPELNQQMAHKIIATHQENNRGSKRVASETEKNAAILHDIKKQTEGAIAKLVLDQLASLPKEDGLKQVWNLNIPFSDNDHLDTLKLIIGRDAMSASEYADRDWSVTLEIVPPNIGPIHCTIVLKNGKIDTFLKGEQKTTSSLIKNHRNELLTRYQKSGIDTGILEVTHGKPILTKIVKPHCLLVDERA